MSSSASQPGLHAQTRVWRTVWIVSGLIALVLAFLVAAGQLSLGPESGAWTHESVENRWNKPFVAMAVGPYWINFGWNPSRRYYAAVPLEDGAYTNVTLVDRIHGRWCTLGTANWTQAQFEGDRYTVHVWNQYGWDATTTLDLNTWEVTLTIRGSCFQSMSCQQHDPPQVIGPVDCNSETVHGPGGLS